MHFSKQYTAPSSKDYQKAIRDWIPPIHQWRNAHAVTLTLKKAINVQDGYRKFNIRLDQTIAQDNLRRFLNILNNKTLGNRAKRYKQRIPAFPLFEGGAGTDTRPHYHLILDCPFADYPPHSYAETIRLCWSKTLWGHREIDVQPQCDDGWTDYITKLRSKYDISQSIDWNNVTLPSADSPLVRHR